MDPRVHPLPHIDAQALERTVAGLSVDGDAPDLPEVLLGVVNAARALFVPHGVGLMLTDDRDALRYVAATDPLAKALEDVQLAVGEGPCIDCYVRGDAVIVTDLEGDTRWPQAGPLLVKAGVRAVLGVPTRVAGTTVGSLNAFSATPGEWDDSDNAAIAAFNTLVEAQLSSVLAARRQGELVDQLKTALEHRVVIERAVGVVMATRGLSAPAAFESMRGVARRERVRVVEIAERVLVSLEPGAAASDPLAGG